MSTTKKKTYAELDEAGKIKILRASLLSIGIVALACCVLVGCFACKQDRTDDVVTQMTDEQKAAYWSTMVADVRWAPQTDDTHDGVLKDMFLPREAKTLLDGTTLRPMIYFMLDEQNYLDSAMIELSSESGKLVFQSDERWDVKFSEKNEVLYMTITDSNGKTVYYQQK